MCEVKNHASCMIEPRKIVFYQAKRCVTLRRVSLAYTDIREICTPKIQKIIPAH